MNEVFVLDACALLAVVRNEEGASVVVEAYRNESDGLAFHNDMRLSSSGESLLKSKVLISTRFENSTPSSVR